MNALDWVLSEWSGWFAEDPPRSLCPLFLAGGPAHRGRASLFLFADADASPRVVIKSAFTREEAKHLRGEFEALRSVRPVLPIDLTETVPRALGFTELDGKSLLATEAMAGRRLLVPHLGHPPSVYARRLFRRYHAEAIAWTRRLADATARLHHTVDEGALEELTERFVVNSSRSSKEAGAVRAFGRALGRSHIRWCPVWQHGDLSVGNVLRHRGGLTLLDWEHASADSPPWLDASYTPVAAILLALGQDAPGSVSEVASRILGRGSWVGSILEDELGRVWNHPLPLAWAVTLTAMRVGLRQETAGRHGGDVWTAFALAALTDPEFRNRVSWLAPEW